MNLYIKNMVCDRCILAVKSLLDELTFAYTTIRLGEVSLSNEPTEKELTLLRDRLQQLGFELLDDSKRKLIEKIKTIIIEQVHYDK
ncbi:MAG: AraC family transcriptional regulator, partial [Chitinophagaceae bacterium]